MSEQQLDKTPQPGVASLRRPAAARPTTTAAAAAAAAALGNGADATDAGLFLELAVQAPDLSARAWNSLAREAARRKLIILRIPWKTALNLEPTKMQRKRSLALCMQAGRVRLFGSK